MTILGALLAVALGVSAVTRRDLVVMLLGVTAGLPYSAAVVVAGNGVPLFTAAGLAASVALLRTPALQTRHWSANAFAVFVAWTTIITVLAPWLFAGLRVLSARGGLDAQVIDPDRLTYTTSTVAQLAYLLVSACIVLLLVRRQIGAGVLDVAFAVGTLTSAVREAVAAFGGDRLAFLFDTNPGVVYGYIGGVARQRGVFSEPSELAAFSLPAVVYFVVAASRSTGGTAACRWAVAAIAAVHLLQASSGTAVVASAVVIAAGALLIVVRYVLRGGRGTPWMVLGSLSIAIVVLAAGDALLQPVAAIVDDKVGSQSYDSRTAGDRFSWGVFVGSLGLGVGVGGNRPSSFALSLLSCTGAPGTLAFLLATVGALAVAFRRPETVAAAAGLVALLVAKVVGTPDLSTPVLWLLVAVCAVPAWRPSCPVVPASTDPDAACTAAVYPIRRERTCLPS